MVEQAWENVQGTERRDPVNYREQSQLQGEVGEGERGISESVYVIGLTTTLVPSWCPKDK